MGAAGTMRRRAVPKDGGKDEREHDVSRSASADTVGDP
jgi:hypothetical protein